MGKIEGYRIFAFCIVIFMGALIFYMSTLTFSTVPQTRFIIHWKPLTYHVGVFFLFASFLLVALSRDGNWKMVLFGILVSFIYAVSDELHQIYVPGRSGTMFDVFTDFLGIVLAGVVFLGFQQRGSVRRV
tara:strand:+ start:25601 stop:25990 length:390 start_codon:yes stop_codon:yes gene_type:complete